MGAKDRSIVILTGAGISAESGVPVFRGADGLWQGCRLEDVASPEAFLRHAGLVHQFYNLRRAALKNVLPNAAHHALARLQRQFSGTVTLVTQNIDDLHERAGSTGVIHMHGELLKAICTHCERCISWEDDLLAETPCPACGATGGMRPDVVWFGEIPHHMERIEAALETADVFAAIGTSGQVYPAAGFVSLARFADAETIEINNAHTMVSGSFASHRIGPASVEVPRWVEELLAQ